MPRWVEQVRRQLIRNLEAAVPDPVRVNLDGMIPARVEVVGVGLQPHNVQVQWGNIFLQGFIQGVEGAGIPILEDQAAANKALVTLKRFLDPTQLRTLDEDQYFEVKGSEGNIYKISTKGSASGNIYWMHEGHVAGQFCAYPKPALSPGKRLPRHDQFLGQMLELVTDENGYLDKANIFDGTKPPSYWKARKRSKVNVVQNQFWDQRGNPCGCPFCTEMRRLHFP